MPKKSMTYRKHQKNIHFFITCIYKRFRTKQNLDLTKMGIKFLFMGGIDDNNGVIVVVVSNGVILVILLLLATALGQV